MLFSGIINLLWLQVPVGVVLSLILGLIWLDPNVLDLPQDETTANQYQISVKLICFASIFDLCGEPFWVVSQIYMYIKFRASVEFFYTLTRAVIMAIVVYFNPESAILAWGWSTLLVSFGIPLINLIFYHNILSHQNNMIKKNDIQREPDDANLMPFTSLREIFPDWTAEPKLHNERFNLMQGFFKQGLLKQILTEGEAYMFTFFNLMSLAEQGVYNIASN